MKINIKNIDVNYIQYGKGKKNVVLLHGWGQNIQMMDPIGKKLENYATITIIDLPGHGESSEPLEALTIYDYCDIVKELLDKLKIKKPILVGHSFGGRISICFAAKYGAEKLILLGAPCIRKNTKVSTKTKVLAFNSGTEYNYNKFDDVISYTSTNNEKSKIFPFCFTHIS